MPQTQHHRDFDLAVIGGGSGGYAAARTAHLAGLKVAVIEGGPKVGGLCILRGCMPTKTLLETAHRVHDIRDAERFGIRVAAPEVDFTAQMERMRHANTLALCYRQREAPMEYEVEEKWLEYRRPHLIRSLRGGYAMKWPLTHSWVEQRHI